MVTSLSRLLERIRPAGAPGAPSRGAGSRHDEDRAAELAEVIAILQRFEDEAATVVDEAERAAADRRAEAVLDAETIRARLPDRLARIDTGGPDGNDREPPDDPGRAAVAAIAAEAEGRAADLRAAAVADIPRLADRVATHILDSLLDPAGQPVDREVNR